MELGNWSFKECRKDILHCRMLAKPSKVLIICCTHLVVELKGNVTEINGVGLFHLVEPTRAVHPTYNSYMNLSITSACSLSGSFANDCD